MADARWRGIALMPSRSPAEKRLMQGVAHDAAFARKVGIPQSVGRDFAAADAAKGGLINRTQAPARKAKRRSGK